MATKPNKPSGSVMKKPKSEDQLWGPAKPVRQSMRKIKSARAASQASRATIKKENRPIAAAKPKPVASPARARATYAAVPVAKTMKKTYSAQAKAYNKTLKKVKGDATKIPCFTMGRNTY